MTFSPSQQALLHHISIKPLQLNSTFAELDATTKLPLHVAPDKLPESSNTTISASLIADLSILLPGLTVIDFSVSGDDFSWSPPCLSIPQTTLLLQSAGKRQLWQFLQEQLVNEL